MSNIKVSRREARESALKIIYSNEFVKSENLEEYYNVTIEDHELKANDFTHSLVFGIYNNLGAIDNEIEKFLVDWKIERISKVVLSIIRLCTYELMFTDVPKEIAINESIEISKKYGEEKSNKFVNGILNSVAGDIKK